MSTSRSKYINRLNVYNNSKGGTQRLKIIEICMCILCIVYSR